MRSVSKSHLVSFGRPFAGWKHVHASLGLVAVVALAAGCTQADVGEEDGEEQIDVQSHGKIIGDNDLVVVADDGANIPAKYGRLLDSFGVLTMGCSATHIGDGLVLTAGHCFNAPSQRKDNVACTAKVNWGYRKDKPAYLTSDCKIILAEQHNSERDYAIFRVEPVPPVHVDADYAERAPVDTVLTIFGHPRRRPLEWSQTCALKAASMGGWGVDQFSHQCDTEPGSSGSSILDDAKLKVVGIHDGGNTRWNYATYLANTPLGEFIEPPGGDDPRFRIRN